MFKKFLASSDGSAEVLGNNTTVELDLRILHYLWFEKALKTLVTKEKEILSNSDKEDPKKTSQSSNRNVRKFKNKIQRSKEPRSKAFNEYVLRHSWKK